MEMLVIVFRESLVEQVHALLNEYEVTSYSELQNVTGKGATGLTSQFSRSLNEPDGPRSGS